MAINMATKCHTCFFLRNQSSLSGGSLQSYLAAHTVLSEPEASRLLRKVMEGLQFLHEAGIIHVNLTVSVQLLEQLLTI